MDRAVWRGIAAPHDGLCGLCGGPFDAGSRKYQLPEKRRGNACRWVCHACRFPDPDRQIDIAFVIRKAEHRMYRLGTSYTPNLAEVELVLAAFATLVYVTPDEERVLRQFQRCQVRRRTSPTLGHTDNEALVGALRRVDPSSWLHEPINQELPR